MHEIPPSAMRFNEADLLVEQLINQVTVISLATFQATNTLSQPDYVKQVDGETYKSTMTTISASFLVKQTAYDSGELSSSSIRDR